MTSFRVQQTLHRPASEGKCLNQAFALIDLFQSPIIRRRVGSFWHRRALPDANNQCFFLG
jgi:hypothetical protein